VTAVTGARPSAERWSWIASIALAVAILAIGAFAVRTLVVDPASSAPAAAAPEAAPSAAPAPAALPAPAGAPSVTDTTGRAVPAAVATGAQGLYTALGTGDLAGVESRYAPSAAFDAAPWRTVAPLLADPAARDQLLAALRANPQRRTGVYRYTAGGATVGMDPQGTMAFLRLP
jgi:hypothetical protein